MVRVPYIKEVNNAVYQDLQRKEIPIVEVERLIRIAEFQVEDIRLQLEIRDIDYQLTVHRLGNQNHLIEQVTEEYFNWRKSALVKQRICNGKLFVLREALVKEEENNGL